MVLATADRDDLVRVIQINAFDGHRVAEDLRREGAGQVLLEHAQKTDTLFRFAVRIDDGFLDQRLDLRFAQSSSSRHVFSWWLCGGTGLSEGLGPGLRRELTDQPVRMGGYAQQDILQIVKRRDVNERAALDE